MELLFHFMIELGNVLMVQKEPRLRPYFHDLWARSFSQILGLDTIALTCVFCPQEGWLAVTSHGDGRREVLGHEHVLRRGFEGNLQQWEAGAAVGPSSCRNAL